MNECPRFGEVELRDEVTDEWDWVVCWRRTNRRDDQQAIQYNYLTRPSSPLPASHP